MPGAGCFCLARGGRRSRRRPASNGRRPAPAAPFTVIASQRCATISPTNHGARLSGSAAAARRGRQGLAPGAVAAAAPVLAAPGAGRRIKPASASAMDASDTEQPFREFVRAQPRRQPEKFTAAMRTFLLSQVMERWSVITDTRIDDRAVYNKRRAWSTVSGQFNTRFPNSGKTVQQLKDLWKRHSIQFRKESREEMALEESAGADSPAAGAVPNEVMFQKLLEWLESNPGEEGADADELSPPPDEDEPPRKTSRHSEEPVEGVAVKEEPPPTPPR